jgi:hypothetical protein
MQRPSSRLNSPSQSRRNSLSQPLPGPQSAVQLDAEASSFGEEGVSSTVKDTTKGLYLNLAKQCLAKQAT